MHAFAESYTVAWCGQDHACVAAHFSPSGSLPVNSASPAVGSVKISGYEQWTLSPDGFRLQSIGRFDEADYQRQLA